MRTTRLKRTLLVLGFAGVVSAAGLAGLWAGRDGTPGDVTQQPTAEARRTQSTDDLIVALQRRIAEHDDRLSDWTALGAAYLQKARESGDPTFYSKAEAALVRAETLDGNQEDADIPVLLGSLALARHEFELALRHGQTALERNPYKAAALGVIGDAQVELGRYEEAFATFDAMVNLRPDLNSYARLSYMRELRGDVPGALDAMQRAVSAGTIGSEARAWTRVQLGHLQFNSGNLTGAEAEYRRTLQELPGYLHARAGIARVQAARGEWGTAASAYEEITKSMPVAEYVVALADVYRAAGQDVRAEEAEALVQVMNQLQRENGVRTDAEMALYTADRGLDPAGTVARARVAFAERPGIHAQDALGWALYRAGEHEEALAMVEEALRLGTKDALLHYHAGVIAGALGQGEKSRTYLQAALAINPHFSVRYAPDAQQRLNALAGSR